MEYKLSDICSGITDGSHNPPAGISNSDYLMLSSKNIFDDEITFDAPRYLSEEQFVVENKRTRIKPGDILMTIVGTVGRTAIVPDGISTITLQRSVAVLHPLKDICFSRYLMYALRSKRKFFESEAHGVAQKGIYLKQLSNIIVDVPELERQEATVQILDFVQNIIKKRHEELDKLDELIKARFVELFGDPITNTKKLETKSLKDVLMLKAGDFTAASDIADEPNEVNKYPCYGGNGIRGYVAEYNQEGDYSLIGRQGALSGNVQYATGQFKNTEHALLVTPTKKMNSIWLNQLLINLDLKRYQTGAAQPGLSVKNLQEIQIITVPIDEQNSYAEFVKQVDKSKATVQKTLDKMQLLFDSLMQQYFG